MKLAGKKALITGSAKGLGKRTAMELASQGCNLMLHYMASGQEAEALKEQLQQHGVEVRLAQADLSNPIGVDQLAAEVERWGGGVDILINNAGPFVRERKLFQQYDRELITSLIQGNLISAMLLDHHVLPYMRSNSWGRIIHFGFGHANEARAWPQRAVYAAAKTALVSFTKSLAVEEAPYGITVNMIGPGDIKGEYKEMSIHEVMSNYDEENPIGRPGTGEDVARVIAFLCDNKSSYLTGNIIDVTGGFDPIKANILQK
ncbi:3-ketoacyl-ACP reductase [Paenibacillus montaniterrae]|uniref:3-ketoacyl-ACP reductase n=1 Tax=Paenibacillus montaniterrae TaxID=429341 RepID=A0A919YLJ7_9BACL|nr:SDR family oxidoreductase [Paenibacillus montaniterrae]GIP15705.1 3-ketoacyl-ACP reductase [Paenibacillus montaniterrae]